MVRLYSRGLVMRHAGGGGCIVCMVMECSCMMTLFCTFLFEHTHTHHNHAPKIHHRLRIRLPDRNHRALVVDVHVGEMVGGLKMVEVAKYSGHSVEFYSFYKYLMESLDGIILKRVEQVVLGFWRDFDKCE